MREGGPTFNVIPGNPRLKLLDNLSNIAREYKSGEYEVRMYSSLTDDEFRFQIIRTDGIVRVGLGREEQGEFVTYLVTNYPDTFNETNLTLKTLDGSVNIIFDLTDYLGE